LHPVFSSHLKPPFCFHCRHPTWTFLPLFFYDATPVSFFPSETCKTFYSTTRLADTAFLFLRRPSLFFFLLACPPFRSCWAIFCGFSLFLFFIKPFGIETYLQPAIPLWLSFRVNLRRGIISLKAFFFLPSTVQFTVPLCSFICSFSILAY